MRKLLDKLDGHRTYSALFVVLSGITFYMLLSNITAIRSAVDDLFYYISPFLIGIIMAYILHPVYVLFFRYIFGRVKNRKAMHALSVVLTVVTAIAIVALILYAIIPELVSSVKTMVGGIDSYYDSLKTLLNNLDKRIPYITIDADQLVNLLNKAFAKLTEWVRKNITDILNISVKFGSGVVDAIVTFIISIYVLAAQNSLLRSGKRFCLAVFKKDTYDLVSRFAKSCHSILKSYIGGNILDAVIIGLVNFIFMSIWGMPNSGLISMLVGVTNLIPSFGPFIGAIPSALILLIFDPKTVLPFIIFTLVIQQIDGNLLKPLLFGDAAGLAPIWVLVSIIVFGRMFGLVGMLLGVPIFAILLQIYNYFIARRFESKGIVDIYGNVYEKKESRLSKISLHNIVEAIKRKTGRIEEQVKESLSDGDHSDEDRSGGDDPGDRHSDDRR